MYNIRPTDGFYGVSGHPASQGNYWNRGSVNFDYQVAMMVAMGMKYYRIDVPNSISGVISNTSPNYSWGRIFGTNPESVNNQGLSNTDLRKNNYGIYYKCQAAGITIIPMFYTAPGSGDLGVWGQTYTSEQDAYDKGYIKGVNLAINYGEFFPYMEIGNELELFTDFQTSTPGTVAGNYDLTELGLAVQNVRGIEEGIKSVRPDIITMFGTSGYFPMYLLERVRTAAPTINKIVHHWYSEMQGLIKNGQLPGDGKSPHSNTFTNIFDYFANRYPGIGIWFTETGYRWSADGVLSYEENMQRQLDRHISIVSDYNGASNAEAYFYHELLEMRSQTAWTREGMYGLIGYPNYGSPDTNINGSKDPQPKLLAQWLMYEEPVPVDGFGLRYTIPYKDIADRDRRVDIEIKGYEGDAITLRGVGDSAMSLNWQPDEENMNHVIISSSATIRVYNQNNIDVFELQTLEDRDAFVRYYEEDVLKWQGFLVPDGITQLMEGVASEVQLQATDGFRLLDGINTTSPNTTAVGTPNRAPINYYRDLLWNSVGGRLGNVLPIKFVCNSLECVVFPEENVMAGSVQWSPRGQGYTDEAGNYKTALWTLEKMTDSFFCRVYQSDGYWVVERKPDIVSGSYASKIVDGVNIINSVENVLRLIGKAGDYRFINEDAMLTVVKQLKKVETTYNHSQNENIIPNGGMEQTLIGNIMYWSKFGDTGNLSVDGTLNLRPGNSLRVQNNGIFGGNDIYVAVSESGVEGLPVESHVLFNRMELGFTFRPRVYPVTGDGTTIDWTSNPLQITVKYTIQYQGGARDYFLNEFGYWQYEARGIGLGVNFNYRTQETIAGGSIMQYIYFTGSPNIGDIISIGIVNSRFGNNYNYYTAECTVTEEGNLELLLAKLRDALPNSIDGYNMGNKLYQMQDANNGYIRYSMISGFHPPQVSAYKGGTLQDYQRISYTVDSMKIDDVARVQIQSKVNEGKIIIPDMGDLSMGDLDDAIGRLYIQLHVKNGQDISFDDVYCNVNENNDVYSAELQTGTNTAKEERSLEISSSFSGFMKSSYMTAWTKSNTEYVFNNGVDSGSLTRLHAIDTMRMRNKPSRLFSGSISTRGREWKFGEVYNIVTLDGINFLSLGATYNTETCVVQLTAIEAYYDTELGLNVKHYGSESEPINV